MDSGYSLAIINSCNSTFESVVLSLLLDWASASIEKSLNQPALPHAVVAINATDTAIDNSQWDVTKATRKLLSSVDHVLKSNPKIEECVRFWSSRGKQISSIEDLLKCYYSSIVAVRVPNKGSYMIMDQQIEKLQKEIVERCFLAQEKKKRLRTISNSDELQIYLQLAYEHFSKHLDVPFDFVEHAMKANPIPQDFGGNILRLALTIRDCFTSSFMPMSGEMIFKNLSHMVASCVMLDFVRHRLKGYPSCHSSFML